MSRVEARLRLIEEYPYLLRVVRRVANRFPTHLRSEAESAALPLMVEAADEWDAAASGYTFRQHVTFRVEHGIKDAVRNFTHVNRATGIVPDAYSLDARISRDEEGQQTGADLLASGDATPHERAVLNERIEGLAVLPSRWLQALTLDTATAMKVLGVSEARVFQIRTSARELLRSGALIPKVVVEPLLDLPPAGEPGLTDREIAVLHLVAVGDTNAEIGTKLHVSTETVKTHIKHLIRSLGARNRTHAVNMAWEAGWWPGAALEDARE